MTWIMLALGVSLTVVVIAVIVGVILVAAAVGVWHVLDDSDPVDHPTRLEAYRAIERPPTVGTWSEERRRDFRRAVAVLRKDRR